MHGYRLALPLALSKPTYDGRMNHTSNAVEYGLAMQGCAGAMACKAADADGSGSGGAGHH